jgi:hypothetical protein
MSRSNKPRVTKKDSINNYITINGKRYYEGEYDDLIYVDQKDTNGNIVWCSVYSKDNEQFDGHYNQKIYNYKIRHTIEGSKQSTNKYKRNSKKFNKYNRKSFHKIYV